MDDLLTTKQLQDLLQVDRVTIYRMLNDGRLRGFKVGGQWRFSRREIDQWLERRRAGLEVAENMSPADSSYPPRVLPLSCVQAIQGVCAEALDIAAITTDTEGHPLTPISNSCEFCNLILSTRRGRTRCEATWKQIGKGQAFECHAGLLCTNALIEVNGQHVAIIAGCQFVKQGWQRDLSALATDLGLRSDDLRSAVGSVRAVPDDTLIRVCRLLERVGDTFSEIGEERLSLLSRLQHIAEVSKL